MTPALDDLPGFSADQTFVIKAVIREAVADGIKDGLEQYRRDNCAGHQANTERLMKTIFGNGTSGLDEDVRMLKAFENRVNRLTWLVVAQLISFIAVVAYHYYT